MFITENHLKVEKQGDNIHKKSVRKMACRNPEEGGGGGQVVRVPLENHKNIVF